MKTIEMYTDGAAISNPNGFAGAGIVLLYNGVKKEFAIPLGINSNFRAELCAIIEGLKLLKEPCTVHLFSDAQVVIDIINGDKQASSNLDLWKDYRFASSEHKVIATWIRKDSNEWNKVAHKLANQAAYSQR